MEKEYTNYKKILSEKMILSDEINTSLKTLTDGEENLATWYFNYDDYVLNSSKIQNKINSNDESLSKVKKYISSCYTFYKNDL